ncbi:MAG: aminotransferase class I/II-fold pyridoxal phosphate-dependent enzyme, partial [Chitinophagaceae bacterium]
ENPVRRADNQAFPFEEMKKISAWCRSKGYKLHLDGARLHMASAFTGKSIKEYAQLFDTVYMCLYKYLGATGGAVLCGDKKVIDEMTHLIKIHGGSIFTNWTNAAMALHHLQDVDAVMATVISKSKPLFAGLAKLGIIVQSPENGTNQFNVALPKGLDPAKFNSRLRAEHNIIFGMPREDGFVKIKVNPTLARRDNEKILAAFTEAMAFAKA